MTPQTRSLHTTPRATARWITLAVLATVAALTIPAIPAHAATYSGGSGAEADPYRIATPADLITLSNTANAADWDKHFRMTNDIDMSGVTTFTPIGNTTTNFTGGFDGGGHAIQNLKIDLPTREEVGFFGLVSNSPTQIKNLGIENCAVTGYHTVGGLIGENNGGTVTACYATGSVTGGSEVGGLIGVNAQWSTVTACYATGEVTGIYFVGGLIGTNGGTINTSFWDMDLTRRPGSSGGKGLTSEQMKSLLIFRNAGWSAYPDWVMTEGQYPRLAWESTGMPSIPAPEPVPLPGSGTPLAPYRVSTPAEFALLSWHAGILNAHIVLTQNLDMAGVVLHPIGDLGPFNGVLDGAGYALSNAELEYPESYDVGIIAFVDTMGVVKDLGVVDAAISGRSEVGGLIGKNCGTIKKCSVTGQINGSEYCGGVVGTNDAGLLINCCYRGMIKSNGKWIGGLVGGNYSRGNILFCFSACSVEGVSITVGGLVGENSHGLIEFCHSESEVHGNENVGGLVGESGCTIYNCEIGIEGINNCFSIGNVIGNENVGGLVGQNNDAIIDSCYTISSVSGETNLGGLVGHRVEPAKEMASFWDRSIGGPDNGIGTGLPTAQMKQRSTFETAGWDFSGAPPTWYIFEGQSYPQLFGIPMPIDSIDALQALAPVDNGNYFLTKDIDARATATWGDKDANPGFEPIGTLARPFNGTLDGRGHRVYNLHISRPTLDGVGLFGCLGANGVVKGIGLDNAAIMGRNQTGGLVGRNLGKVAQCYVRGNVSGVNAVGGLAGENTGSVTESYAATVLSGNAVGGLVGVDNGGSVFTSFWDTELSGTAYSGGGTGLLTSGMRLQSTYRDSGWDFNNTWAIADGLSYPYLQNSGLARILIPPPRLINAAALDIPLETAAPGVFITISGGAYPAYARVLSEGYATISVSLKQEAINELRISTLSETGIETAIADYTVYESDQMPSTAVEVLGLTLTPSFASLAAGSYAEFKCFATFADGTVGDATPTVSWNATGGTITVGGLYTHGSGTGTVQALLHTEQGWQYSNTAAIATAKGEPASKATGRVLGVLRSNYTGLGLPDGQVTAYHLANPAVSGQYPILDALGNFAFLMNEGKYHFEGSCPGHRSELLRGGVLLEPSALTHPGPPPQYSAPYYSGQVKTSRPLTHNFSLRPNDAQAPWVVFIEPVADATVNTENIVVTAIDADKYSELAAAQYTHNAQRYDIPEKISSTGFYRDTWALQPGLNVLHLFTADTEGNASEKTIQITYDPSYHPPGADTDRDGLPNAWETAHGLNPYSSTGVHGAQGDLDGDGLSNFEEYQRGTLPNSARSDADDLTDDFEVMLGADPLNPDTDGDGVDDDIEWAQGGDPLRDDRIKTFIANLHEGMALRGDAITLVADAAAGYPLGSVASVSFEARGTSTGGAWRVIGTDAAAPFTATWNTTPYPEGAYQLRAVATSHMGCVDAAPPAIAVALSSSAPYFERIDAGVHTLSAPVSAALETVLALRTGDRFARITIPAGALAANDTLTAFFPDPSGFTPALSTMQRDAGLYLDLRLAAHSGNFLNGKRATLELGYPDADRDDRLDGSGLRVPMLSVNYLPAPTAAFTALAASSIDRAAQCVSAETAHFSVFGILEEQPAPPLNLLTESLPQGTVGAPYTAPLEAEGGATPYAWTLAAGALPNGLTIVGNTIQGTPAASGEYAFTLQVADAASTPQTAARAFTLGVYAAGQPAVTVTRAAGQPGIANALPARWTITFAQSVTDFAPGGIMLTGTAAPGAVMSISGSGATYTLAVSSVLRDGTLHPAVRANSVTPANRASTSEEEIWLDRRKPQVLITCAAPGVQEYGATTPLVLTALPAVFSLTFDEPVTGLGETDITFADNPAGLGFNVFGEGKDYTLLVTALDGPATLTPAIAANAVTDNAGNGILAAAYTGREVQYAPETRATVTLEQRASQLDPVNAFPIFFDIAFSAPVAGFDANDVVYIGTAPNPQYNLTGSGAAYTLTVTNASGDGRIAFRIPPEAVDGGNAPSTSLDNVVTYDATRPKLTISAPSSSKTRQGPVSFVITYTGASAISLAPSHITLEGAPTAQVAVSPGANPHTRIATLSNLTGMGPLTLRIAPGTATDAAGNHALAAGPSAPIDVDPRLTLTINQAPGQRDPNNRLPILFDVLFADDVTGFTPEDVIQDGAATGLTFDITGSGSVYTLAVTAVAEAGAISPRLPAGACQGVWGGISEASTSTDNTVYYDPALALAMFSAEPLYGAAPLTVQFTDQSILGIAPIDDWHWDFGDGQTSQEQHPEHRYDTPGTYDVTLTVSTTAGPDAWTRQDYITVEAALPLTGPMAIAFLTLLLCLATAAWTHKKATPTHPPQKGAPHDPIHGT